MCARECSDSVCSYQGTCDAAGACVCSEGFGGATCATCAAGYYSVPGAAAQCGFQCDAATTCSGHGTCDAASGACACDAAFAGDAACSVCAPGRSGATCDIVCVSGQCGLGSCNPAPTSPADACVCPNGEDPTSGCVGKSCDSGCSGHGDCQDGTCLCSGNFAGAACAECAADYFGADCSVHCAADTCAGSCTSAGRCVCPVLGQDPDQECRGCLAGYYPSGDCTQQCHAADCGHGSCSMDDALPKCLCADGWGGDACAACADGRYGADCSASCVAGEAGCLHGSCVAATGACACEVGWAGAACDGCAAHYFPAGECTQMCDPAVTCHGHGTCTADGDCQCHSGWANDEVGQLCAVCETPYYFGPTCADKCVGGTYTAGVGCTCFSSDAEGHYSSSSPSCEVCAAGYTGDHCEIACTGAIAAATLSDDAATIVVTFAQPVLQPAAQSAPCSSLFTISGGVVLGGCEWASLEDGTAVVATISNPATPAVGASISAVAGAILVDAGAGGAAACGATPAVAGSATVAAPEGLPALEAELVATPPVVVGTCADLSVEFSVSASGATSSVQWGGLAALASATGMQAVVTGSADFPPVGASPTTFVVWAVVQDGFGRSVNATAVLTRAATLGAPSVVVPALTTVPLGQSATVVASPQFGACVDLATAPAADWSWTIPSGIAAAVSTGGPVASVSLLGVAVAPGDYSLVAKACAPGTSDCNEGTAVLRVSPVALVAGVDVPAVVASAASISVAAVVSDPALPADSFAAAVAAGSPGAGGETVAWDCAVVNGAQSGPCPTAVATALAALGGRAGGTIAAPAGGWRAVLGDRGLRFNVTVGKNGRLATTAASSVVVLSRVAVVPVFVPPNAVELRQGRSVVLSCLAPPQPAFGGAAAAVEWDVVDADGASVDYPGSPGVPVLSAQGLNAATSRVERAGGQIVASVELRHDLLSRVFARALLRCRAFYGAPSAALAAAVGTDLVAVTAPGAPQCDAACAQSSEGAAVGSVVTITVAPGWRLPLGVRLPLVYRYRVTLGHQSLPSAVVPHRSFRFVPWADGVAEVEVTAAFAAAAQRRWVFNVTVAAAAGTTTVADISARAGAARAAAVAAKDYAGGAMWMTYQLMRIAEVLGVRRQGGFNVSDVATAVQLATSQLASQPSSPSTRAGVLASTLLPPLAAAAAARALVPAATLQSAMQVLNSAVAQMGGTPPAGQTTVDSATAAEIDADVAAAAAILAAWGPAGATADSAAAGDAALAALASALSLAARPAPKGSLAPGAYLPTAASAAAAAAREVAAAAQGVAAAAVLSGATTGPIGGANVSVVVAPGAFNATGDAAVLAVALRGAAAALAAPGRALAGPLVWARVVEVAAGAVRSAAVGGGAGGVVRIEFTSAVDVAAQCGARSLAAGGAAMAAGALGVRTVRDYAQRRVVACEIAAANVPADGVVLAPLAAACTAADVCGGAGNGTCAAAGAADVCACAAGRNATVGCAACLSRWGPPGLCASTCFNANTSSVCSGHGLCVDFRCQCASNGTAFRYDGAVCQTCAQGFWGPSCVACPRACGAHGACSPTTGECVCDSPYGGATCLDCAAGWYGATCNVSCSVATTCRGAAGAECSLRGTCVCRPGWDAATNCTACLPGFIGANCSVACPGPSSSAPCSLRGRCGVSPTNASAAVCTCDANFDAAFDCGRCSAGWAGVNCTTPANCTGPASCSGHGACGAATGACVCDYSATSGYWGGPACAVCAAGYYGANCTVLCTNATCVAPGGVCGATGCACAAGYVGVRCDACATGVYRNVSTGLCSVTCSAATTCSGHGVCAASNTTSVACACTQSASLGYYTGPSCADCSPGYRPDSAGACVLPCDPAAACSGHGVCARGGNRTCACFGEAAAGAPPSAGNWARAAGAGVDCGGCAPGWVGAGCNVTCAAGCSPAGTRECAGGACVCQAASVAGFWAGARCDTCAAGYSGPSCAAPCRSETTCSGHGVCGGATSASVCSCARGWALAPQGGGAACSACEAGWYPGGVCAVQCTPAANCSAVGACTVNGTCACPPTFAGASCEKCAAGWGGAGCAVKTGSTCTPPLPATAVVVGADVSPRGDAVVVRFSAATDGAGVPLGTPLRCASLGLTTTPALEPRANETAGPCAFESPTALRITLDGATTAVFALAAFAGTAWVDLRPPPAPVGAADPFVNAAVFSGSRACGAPAGGSAQVAVPVGGVAAAVVTVAASPAVPSACDTVTFTAAAVCAGGCIYSWSASLTPVGGGANAPFLLPAVAGAVLALPPASQPNGTLAVTATAVPVVGAAVGATVAVAFSTKAVRPRVTLPTAVSVPWQAAASLPADIQPSPCAGNATVAGSAVVWACPGVSLAANPTATAATLELPWAALAATAGRSVVCSVAVTAPAPYTATANVSVTVTVAPPPLTVAVTPAVATLGTAANSTTTITSTVAGCDAPATCVRVWSACPASTSAAASDPCPVGGELSVPPGIAAVAGSSAASVAVTVAGAAAGQYRVVLSVTRGAATSRAGALLVVVAGAPPPPLAVSVASSTPGGVATAGAPLRFSAAAVGGDVAQWVWAIAPPPAAGMTTASGPDLLIAVGGVPATATAVTATATALGANGAVLGVAVGTVRINGAPTPLVAPRLVGVATPTKEGGVITAATLRADWRDDDPDGLAAAPLTWRWVGVWGTAGLDAAVPLADASSAATRTLTAPALPAGATTGTLRVYAVAVDRFGAEGTSASAGSVSIAAVAAADAAATAVALLTPFSYPAAATAAALAERAAAGATTDAASTSAKGAADSILSRVAAAVATRTAGLTPDQARSAVAALAPAARVLAPLTAAQSAAVQQVVAEAADAFSADAAAPAAELMQAGDGRNLLDLLVAVIRQGVAGSARDSFQTRMGAVLNALSAGIDATGGAPFSYRSDVFGFYASGSLTAAALTGTFTATGAAAASAQVPAAAAASIASGGRRVRITVRTTGVALTPLLVGGGDYYPSSAVVAVEVYATDGSRVAVAGLSDPIVVSVPGADGANVAGLRCATWREATSVWAAMDGDFATPVATATTTVVSCRTPHLSIFGVAPTPSQGGSGGWNKLWLLLLLLLLLPLCILLVVVIWCCCRRTHSAHPVTPEAYRVDDPSKPQKPHRDDGPEGMADATPLPRGDGLEPVLLGHGGYAVPMGVSYEGAVTYTAPPAAIRDDDWPPSVPVKLSGVTPAAEE